MIVKQEFDGELQDKIRICIKKFLAAHGMTDADLAERMGVSLQTVRNYLSSSKLTLRTVKRMSEALSYPYSLLSKGELYLGETKIQELERRIKAIEDFLWGDR